MIEPGREVRIMERAFVQVVAPGVVGVPGEFPVCRLFEHGNLLVLMPDRPLLVALKLVRGSEQDLDDVRWWMTRFALGADEVRAAIATLPGPAGREVAWRNLGRL